MSGDRQSCGSCGNPNRRAEERLCNRKVRHASLWEFARGELLRDGSCLRRGQAGLSFGWQKSIFHPPSGILILRAVRWNKVTIVDVGSLGSSLGMANRLGGPTHEGVKCLNQTA
jgi:hypothetical protein